jgi:chaperonin cofactor prefoldin
MYLSRKELSDVVEQINKQFERLDKRLEALENATKERPEAGESRGKRVQQAKENA